MLGLLNSRLLKWVFQHDNFLIVGKPLAQVTTAYLKKLPIIVATDQSPVISLVDKLLESHQARFDKAKQFTDYIAAKHSPKAISERLSGFYAIDFKAFLSELKTQRVKLTPKQEMELMPLFNEKAKELVDLSNTIEKLENELDQMIYQLYNLTPDEISIVEGK